MKDCQSTALDWRLRGVGALLVVAGLYLQLRLMGPPLSFLCVGLVFSWILWAFSPWKARAAEILPIYLLGLVAYSLHFSEEYAFGFQRVFPALFQVTWRDTQFVLLNLTWMGIFLLAAVGVIKGYRLAYLPVIFFGVVGGIANGIGHIGFSVSQRAYFPGTVTVPLMLVLGVLILRHLFRDRE